MWWVDRRLCTPKKKKKKTKTTAFRPSLLYLPADRKPLQHPQQRKEDRRRASDLGVRGKAALFGWVGGGEKGKGSAAIRVDEIGPFDVCRQSTDTDTVRTMSVVLSAMRKRESWSANCLLRRSPIQPNRTPPQGRTTNAPAMTEKLSISWASFPAGGKKAAPVG